MYIVTKMTVSKETGEQLRKDFFEFKSIDESVNYIVQQSNNVTITGEYYFEDKDVRIDFGVKLKGEF